MSLAVELPQVRPISDLRTRLNEIEAEAKETRRPIVLTRNGASSLVVMDSDAFNEGVRHERAVRKLREAEIEAKYKNETFAHSDVRKRVAAILEAAETALKGQVEDA